MIYILDIYWIILCILILLFDIYCLHSLIASKFGKDAPFVPTIGNQKTYILNEIRKILEASKENLTIIDAGCGNGSILLTLASEFKNHQFVGIEWSLPLYKYCVWQSKCLKNIVLVHQDMFTYSFSKADIIISFLVPKMAKEFGDTMEVNIKDSCLIFSNGIEFKQLEVVKESRKFKGLFRQRIYVYKKQTTINEKNA